MTDSALQAAGPEVPYSVRFYRPGDEEGILRVLQASFPRWPEVETSVAPIDHLRWKLAGDAPPVNDHIVAEADGQVVGVRLAVIRRYDVFDRALRCRMDVDMAVLPEYRGRGINSAVVRFGVEVATANDLLTASTGRESIVEMDRGLGHRDVGNRLVSTVCDLPESAESPPTAGDTSITEIDRFDERIESFWRTAARPFDFIVVPSRDDLNWRYCDMRGGIGTVLQAEERGEVVGFAALRLSRGKGYIAYLLVLPERLAAAGALVRRSLAYFRNAGVAEVVCGLPEHHPYGPLLTDEGFARKSHVIPLTCRPVREELDLSFLQEPKAAVHLMLGDTDMV
jgi:GNAT superfamily N-acetyltransferase